MDPPDNSSFDEMDRTLAMGWNVDGLESVSVSCAELAHGAGGSDAGGLTEVFTHTSLGTDAKSTPPERPSNHEFSDGIHRGHKEGFPPLKTRLAPLMGVTGVASGNPCDGQSKGKGEMSRVTVGTETDFAAGEQVPMFEAWVVAGFP